MLRKLQLPSISFLFVFFNLSLYHTAVSENSEWVHASVDGDRSSRLTVVISHCIRISNHYVVYLKLMLCYMSIISQFKNVFMHCFTKYNQYILKSMAFAPVRSHCSPHASPGLIRLRPYSGDSFHLEHPVSASVPSPPHVPLSHHLPHCL